MPKQDVRVCARRPSSKSERNPSEYACSTSSTTVKGDDESCDHLQNHTTLAHATHLVHLGKYLFQIVFYVKDMVLGLLFVVLQARERTGPEK